MRVPCDRSNVDGIKQRSARATGNKGVRTVRCCSRRLRSLSAIKWVEKESWANVSRKSRNWMIGDKLKGYKLDVLRVGTGKLYFLELKYGIPRKRTGFQGC